jgi:hypothetical protein
MTRNSLFGHIKTTKQPVQAGPRNPGFRIGNL